MPPWRGGGFRGAQAALRWLEALALQAELAKRKGVGLEVHVPTERKAAELRKLLDDEKVKGIQVRVTPR